ncbi:MAG: hypothetical protein KatS3mg095_0562 [Candidatus Parcubacteria bacterium]|nr:MAG: hypothetical protein KatS3mg095_0562 [Candidatus Parcubacteria bacterium]
MKKNFRINVFIILVLFLGSFVFALPYKPGETLNPNCRPAETNCTVNFFWSATTTGIYYLDGNVGIGVNNPENKLDVMGRVRVNDLVINSIATESGIYWQSKNSNLRIYEDYDLPGWSLFRSDKNRKIGFVVEPDVIGLSILNKYLHGATRTVVGIGTKDPGEKLTVVGNVLVLPYSGSWQKDGDSTKISLGDGFNYVSSVFGKGLILGSWGNIIFKDHTGEKTPGEGKELMRITSDGKVGIGTNNPNASLHIEVPGQPDSFQLGDSEALRITTKNYFTSEGPSVDAVVIEKTDDDPIVEGGIVFGFSTSSGYDTPITSSTWAKGFYSVMTLRGNGNIGIGVEQPRWKLEVKGMINASDDGISTKVINGPVSDQNFYGQPHNGLIGIDAKNGRLYFRANDKWHYISKTGGFQVPNEEVGEMKLGDFVLGLLDQEMSDGALHGIWVTLKDALAKLGILVKDNFIAIKELFVDKLVTREICSQNGKCLEINDELIENLSKNHSPNSNLNIQSITNFANSSSSNFTDESKSDTSDSENSKENVENSNIDENNN